MYKNIAVLMTDEDVSYMSHDFSKVLEKYKEAVVFDDYNLDDEDDRDYGDVHYVLVYDLDTKLNYDENASLQETDSRTKTFESVEEFSEWIEENN